MFSGKKIGLSKIVLLIISVFLLTYRMSNVVEKEISWDVLGYYLYLPATFIHDDPGLSNVDWLKKVNEEKQLTGTLYMVSTNEKGEPMYFFLSGWSYFYWPFFLLACLVAKIANMPIDGFSPPFQYMMVLGATFYTIIGLVFLRKILKSFFSETIVGIVFIVLVFGTNYIQHQTIKNLETVNLLFMLVSIVTWYTICWHKNQKYKYLLILGATITLTALVKPSEVFIALIPLLWGVYSFKTFKEKLVLLFGKNILGVLSAVVLGVIIVSPQLLYWYSKTGHFIYDSYQNPGVGLDFFSPHIMNVLFSYRKGWLLYTPIMIFFFAGFYFFYKENKPVFWASFLYVLISFWVVSSWTEWWYGAAYSCRPMITTYPIMCIALGYFVQFIFTSSRVLKLAVNVVAVALIILNQFQWWQVKNYILDLYRTNEAYYWSVFLKTQVTEEDKALLMVNRDFSGEMNFDDKHRYYPKLIQENTFEEVANDNVLGDEKGKFYHLKPNEEFGLSSKYPYFDVTAKDHVWVAIELDAKFDTNFSGEFPFIVCSMARENGTYAYKTKRIEPKEKGSWETFTFEYLTPEIRNVEDEIHYYIWDPSKQGFFIDNLSVKVYERRGCLSCVNP